MTRTPVAGRSPNVRALAGAFALPQASTSAAVVPFARDTFTDTAGVSITTHVPETATWSKWFGTDAVISDANRLRGAGNGYFFIGTPAGADYSVQADFVFFTDDDLGHARIGARVASTGSGLGYMVQYYAGGATPGFYLHVVTGGAYTQIGSNYVYAFPASGTSATVKLEVIGSAIKVYVDGVERISATDATHAGAGQPAIRFDRAATNSTGVHLDNFVATDI